MTFQPETLESRSKTQKTQGSDYVLITSTFRSDRSWSKIILWFWFRITPQRIALDPRGIIYPQFGNHCLITMINQGSKVTTEKLCVLFCSAWGLALHCKILNEHSPKCHSRNQQMFQQRISNFFGPIFLKNVKFKMFAVLEIQIQFQKFQSGWAQKTQIFPLMNLHECWWGSNDKSQFFWIT